MHLTKPKIESIIVVLTILIALCLSFSAIIESKENKCFRKMDVFYLNYGIHQQTLLYIKTDLLVFLVKNISTEVIFNTIEQNIIEAEKMVSQAEKQIVECQFYEQISDITRNLSLILIVFQLTLGIFYLKKTKWK